MTPIEVLSALKAIVTTNYESKEQFIARVRALLEGASMKPTIEHQPDEHFPKQGITALKGIIKEKDAMIEELNCLVKDQGDEIDRLRKVIGAGNEPSIAT